MQEPRDSYKCLAMSLCPLTPQNENAFCRDTYNASDNGQEVLHLVPFSSNLRTIQSVLVISNSSRKECASLDLSPGLYIFITLENPYVLFYCSVFFRAIILLKIISRENIWVTTILSPICSATKDVSVTSSISYTVGKQEKKISITWNLYNSDMIFLGKKTWNSRNKIITFIVKENFSVLWLLSISSFSCILRNVKLSDDC